ncbi:hypothetical protein [Spirochaeta africana]|uniref:Outer membrane protein beta-barrel domain-containing protein n=1 Tax=Spirochaeta africana (strain ATCC 700263 / DSM 8902 / Z-7692) TaxID=889378 RepID=H9UIP3_SPIAZ|nr:hypothetical protein [Spirochaeta africana]AFG37386.1 hypothetical protein Spiaf_1311 [Spirochaeta africana DSM 8902]
MRHTILLAFLCMAIVVTSVSADEPDTTDPGDGDDISWGAYFEPGDISATFGLGLGGWGYRGTWLNLYPGLELTLAQVDVVDVIPLSFGVSGRGNITWYRGYWGESTMIVNAGGFGTIHLGFREFDVPVRELNNLDVYVGIGMVYDIIRPAWSGYNRLRLASYQGVNYFLNDNLAVFAESTYMGRYSHFGTIGILFKN